MHKTLAVAFGAEVVAAGALAVAALNPQVAGAQKWVAVAASPSTTVTSEAHNQDSQATAESLVKQYCSALGATDCKVLGSTMSGCLAVAWSKAGPNGARQYSFAAGATRDTAATNALATCTQSGSACFVNADPCAGDTSLGPSPLPLPPTPAGGPLTVDKGLVGTWQASVPGGVWIWQIAANGTYTFRSDSTDHAPSHVGTFTASNGKYTLHAYNIVWDDQGTYTIEPGGNSVVFNGKLGSGTYTRVASSTP